MAHLIESGNLTLEDVKEAEQTLKKLPGGAKRKDEVDDDLTSLNHLWQSTLVAAALALLALAFRRAAPPAALLAVAGGVAQVPRSVRALLVALGNQLDWRAAIAQALRSGRP